MNTTSVKLCPACGCIAEPIFAAYPLDYVSAQQFPIYRCTECGHGTTCVEQKADGGALTDLYECGNYDESRSRIRVWAGLLAGALERSKVRSLSRWARTGRVFEIGAGKGRFLFAASRAGYDVSGIEPSNRSYQHAFRVLGARVTKETLEEHVSRAEDRHDVVYLWHVLEHFADPDRSLQQMKQLLVPGGLVIVAVPNFGSAQACLGGRYWYHLDPPRHIHHFTVKSLTRILSLNGYDIISVSHSSFYQNWLGEAITLLNRLSSHKNVLINAVKNRKAFFTSTGTVKGVLSIVWNAVMFLTLLPVTLMATLINQIRADSGTIVAVARMTNPKVI